MSTKSRNLSTRTVTQKPQVKPKRTTSEQKLDSARNDKEKIDEKKPKNEQTKLNSPATKEKTKTIAKEPPKVIRNVRKPLVAQHKNISSVRTPTSQNDRIVKTKFFPSKNNYSEMLQHINKYEAVGPSGDKKAKNYTAIRRTEPKIGRDARNKNVPLPEPEIGREEDNSESTSTSERPRTSTLRKGSIVNENIAGPEAPRQIPLVSPPKETTDNVDEEPDYEDDFDSYESDFENVSSSDSTIHNIYDISTESTSSSEEETSSKATPSMDKDIERKLDSGNFDLNEVKRKQEFSHLQELVEKDNMKLNRPSSNARSNFTSLSDEGFEEAKSLQFMNFVSAKKRNERRRSLEIRKKRGEELLNMIKLDCINFTIFDTPSVPYEDFIKAYGNVNSIQTGVQTGEENVNEEIQTETVENCDKWTQMPPHVSKEASASYKYERLGVGPSEDRMKAMEKTVDTPQFSEIQLSKFLSNTGGLVLDILKEQRSKCDRMVSRNSESSFSEAVMSLKPPTEFSGKRKLSQIVSNPKNTSVFVSVHVDEESDDFSKSMVYLWNVNDVLPELYMSCYGRVRSCCFGFDQRNVIAGLHDGSLVVWDTTRKTTTSENTHRLVEGDVVVKTPVYVTDIEKSHFSSVVSVSCVSESNVFDVFDEVESIWKIFSLDNEGTVIIWSVIALQNFNVTQNGGAAFWGGIMLIKNFEVALRNLLPDMEELLCSDMFVSRENSRSVFIATTYGSVLQCDLSKDKTQVKIHTSEIASPIKCLAACPFSDTFFLGGLENGSIILYSRKSSRPLMVLTNKESGNVDASIDEIQWSSEKPCIFYTKNSRNIIDAWDLSKSSLFPVESLNFEGDISCMKLTRSKQEKSYMLIATENTIQVHHLAQDHKRENEDQYSKEMKTFLTYVSRL